MKTEKLYELKEMMCRELDNIAGKGELSAGDLEAAHKLTDTIKNIDKIFMLEESGYSNDGEWDATMRGSYGNSYRHRDSMGRYSRTDGYNGGSYRYSRTGYSRDGAIDTLTRMMDEAGSEKEREALRRCIDSMR